ncbi:MAG: hypothetical protein DRN05_06505 [Thermoplasmata archaeon]|nr:MAG: hypothetical protein DRN05_06505 [Thermoplasmata archaeon]
MAAFYWPLKETKGFKLAGYYIAMGLIFLSFLFSLTRTVWVSTVLTLLVIPFVIRRSLFLSKTLAKLAAYTAVVLLVATVLFPKISLPKLVHERVESFATEEAFSESYMTREEGFRTELNIWLRGSIVLGTGASLPLRYVGADPFETGALGHVGLATYLSHYGIAGVLIYLIVLPLVSIKVSKICYLSYFPSYKSRVSLVTLACILMGVLACLSSEHYISATSHVPGLIYGAVWGIWSGPKEKQVKKEVKYR